jgi:cytochrome P450
MFGTSLASVGTVQHDLHRVRRSALNPFFSKSAVVKLEPIIQAHVDRLVERLRGFTGTSKPVNLNDAFTALSADVIGAYAFGKSYHFLDAEDFEAGWNRFMMNLSRGTHLMKQFGWAYTILTWIPESLVALVHPLSRELFKLRRGIADKVEAAATDSKGCQSEKSSKHRSIFHGLHEAGTLPASEMTNLRLTEEGLTIIGAGTVTTAHTLAIIVFHILANQTIQSRVRSELATSPTPRTWTSLSQLPYLSAILNEGLRLSFGVSHRLQRSFPDTELIYKDPKTGEPWIIPRNTPVSLTNMFIHLDPSIFPSPESFIPDRWLVETRDEKFPPANEAKRFLVPFSKGTRSCLGMNLAYVELFLVVGALFGENESLDMELFQTDVVDVECKHDFFNPSPRLDSKGVRVLISKLP